MAMIAPTVSADSYLNKVAKRRAKGVDRGIKQVQATISTRKIKPMIRYPHY